MPLRRPHTPEEKAQISITYRKNHPIRMADCHPDRKHNGKGLCHSCYQRQWTLAHPGANTGAQWFKNNPEKFYRIKRNSSWKKKGININFQGYEALWEKQQGKCANPSCLSVFPKYVKDHRRGSLQVDHDHTTGEIRGLLCGHCNYALGLLKDDLNLVQGLILYLNKT